MSQIIETSSTSSESPAEPIREVPDACSLLRNNICNLEDTIGQLVLRVALVCTPEETAKSENSPKERSVHCAIAESLHTMSVRIVALNDKLLRLNDRIQLN